MTIEERVNSIAKKRREEVDKELAIIIPNVQKILEFFENADTGKDEYLWKIKIRITGDDQQLWGDWGRACFWFGDILKIRTTCCELKRTNQWDDKEDLWKKYYGIAKEITFSRKEIKAIYLYLEKNFSDKFDVSCSDAYLEVELKL